jgi:hypothetical protein
MASKNIMDAPKLLEEQLITLMEACKEFPRPVARPTLERWMRRGSRGCRLESVLVCGRRMTSREACERFIRAQLRVEPQLTETRKGTMSKRKIVEASKRFKLPEPLGKESNHTS